MGDEEDYDEKLFNDDAKEDYDSKHSKSDLKKLRRLQKQREEAEEKESLEAVKAEEAHQEILDEERKIAEESEYSKEIKKQTFLGRKSRKGEPVKKEKDSFSKKIKQAKSIQFDRPAENIDAEVERKNLERLQSGIEREQKIVQAEKEEQEAISQAESRKAELDLKIKEVEMKEQVAQQEKESIVKQKSDQEKRIESRIKQLAEIIPEAKKKDIEKAEEYISEKAQLESDLDKIKSEPETKSGYDITEDAELARLGLIPKDVGLTESEKKLEENKSRKEKIQQILDEKREVLSETAKQKLEKEKLELQRRDIKLQKEARLERDEQKKTEKLQKLRDKKEKLTLKKDLITLKAQRKIQARTIQDKRRELLQKNLAFIATRGAVRYSKEYLARQRAKQRATVEQDRMMVSTPNGESKVVKIGDEGIPDTPGEEGFDLIKELTGESESSSNDPIAKKVRLL